jgi:hypothetical protein
MKAFYTLLISLFLLVSWGTNVYKLTAADFEPGYKEEVVRVLAVPLMPVSAVVAWMDLKN